MTAYQVMPGLLPEEYDALRNDIAANGIRVPIDVDENGQVLDGHHRSLIAAELGIDCPRRVLADLDEAGKVAHALAVNVHRRNLTREQRRDLLAASIRAEPSVSDREHGRRVGVDHKTASAARTELEATGEIPQLHERRGADGRDRPSTQPARSSVSVTTKETFDVDRDTGEVLTEPEWREQNDSVEAIRAGVKREPGMRAAAAMENFARGRRTLAEGGTAAQIAADLDEDPGLAESLLLELDKCAAVIQDLTTALRRRNLRSVKP